MISQRALRISYIIILTITLTVILISSPVIAVFSLSSLTPLPMVLKVGLASATSSENDGGDDESNAGDAPTTDDGVEEEDGDDNVQEEDDDSTEEEQQQGQQLATVIGEVCDDFEDNDGDGLIDLADAEDCSPPATQGTITAPTTTPAPPTPSVTTNTTATNSTNNTLTASEITTREITTLPSTDDEEASGATTDSGTGAGGGQQDSPYIVEVCGNRIDDDGDGLADLDDFEGCATPSTSSNTRYMLPIPSRDIVDVTGCTSFEELGLPPPPPYPGDPPNLVYFDCDNVTFGLIPLDSAPSDSATTTTTTSDSGTGAGGGQVQQQAPGTTSPDSSISDIPTTNPDGSITYNRNGTIVTVYPDGTEVHRTPTGPTVTMPPQSIITPPGRGPGSTTTTPNSGTGGEQGLGQGQGQQQQQPNSASECPPQPTNYYTAPARIINVQLPPSSPPSPSSPPQTTTINPCPPGESSSSAGATPPSPTDELPGEDPLLGDQPPPEQPPTTTSQGQQVQQQQQPQQGPMTTKLPDGGEMTTYPGGVKRATYPDGTTITLYPNGASKINYADGSERTNYPNGAMKASNADGSEIFTKDSKGKVTTIFPDSGVSVAQYPNGEGFIDFPDGSRIYRSSNGELTVLRPPGISYSAADWEFRGMLGCLQKPLDCVTWWTIGNVN